MSTISEAEMNGVSVQEKQEVVEIEVDLVEKCHKNSGFLSDVKEKQEISSEGMPDQAVKAENEVKLSETQEPVYVDVDEKFNSYENSSVTKPGDEAIKQSLDIGNLKQEMVGKSVKGFTRNGSKRSYSRNEMESIGFLNVEEQQKMWNEVYIRLGSDVAREYDGIACRKSSDQGRQRYPKRKENDPILGVSKKKGNGPILGEVCCQRPGHNLKENIVGGDGSQRLDHLIEDNSSHFACTSRANDEATDCKLSKNEYDESIGSESEDESDNIQKPAFLVEGDPDFDSGPPQDGLEYLRRVRWETAQIPKVKVAKLDKINLKSEQTVYMPMIPDIAKCPEHVLPSKDWENSFLADFSDLRLALTRLDSLSPLKSSDLQKHFNINEDDFGDPMLSRIIGMDAVSRASMLRSRIRSIEAMSTLSRTHCAWLYALCAVVDTPFDADTGASLRCLLRKCAKLLSEKSDCDDEVAMLNILVTISGRYFGQSEN